MPSPWPLPTSALERCVAVVACKSDQGQTVDILWPQLSDKYTSCHKNSLWLLITVSAWGLRWAAWAASTAWEQKPILCWAAAAIGRAPSPSVCVCICVWVCVCVRAAVCRIPWACFCFCLVIYRFFKPPFLCLRRLCNFLELYLNSWPTINLINFSFRIPAAVAAAMLWRGTVGVGAGRATP